MSLVPLISLGFVNISLKTLSLQEAVTASINPVCCHGNFISCLIAMSNRRHLWAERKTQVGSDLEMCSSVSCSGPGQPSDQAGLFIAFSRQDLKTPRCGGCATCLGDFARLLPPPSCLPNSCHTGCASKWWVYCIFDMTSVSSP